MRNPSVADAELARRAASGDAGAFGALVDRHAEAVRRAARALLGNEHDADDAAQDGLLAAWRAIDRYDSTRPFRPWLMRIVLNAARDLQRRGVVRRAEPISPTEAAPGASPERETDRVLIREKVARALAALPERQRLAVTMFDAEGYAHAEIAEALGIPEGTVRSDVFHARRSLRATLGSLLEEMR
jgi:RNA polymerase sigma-70 factor (ECF subfamily)